MVAVWWVLKRERDASGWWTLCIPPKTIQLWVYGGYAIQPMGEWRGQSGGRRGRRDANVIWSQRKTELREEIIIPDAAGLDCLSDVGWTGPDRTTNDLGTLNRCYLNKIITSNLEGLFYSHVITYLSFIWITIGFPSEFRMNFPRNSDRLFLTRLPQ